MAMSHFPYTSIIHGPSKTLVTCGPHLHVLDANTGAILHSTTHLQDSTRDAVLKSGPIRCCAVDSAFVHAITVGDDKRLKVWNIPDGLRLVNERELPKKPTEMRFTRDGQTFVVSDKFGDVFSYPLHFDAAAAADPAAAAGASKRGSLTSHENPSNGTLVLGHASLLTSFLLTPDERFIITADRDEHVRVSWYPQGYAVERYCLGHQKFVSAIHLPAFEPSTLFSGGADPMIKVWDWMAGKLLSEIPVLETAEPYIRVRAPKRKRWYGGDDDDGEGERVEAAGDDKKTKGKGKGKRSRGKAKGAGKQAGTAEEAPDGDIVSVPETPDQAAEEPTPGGSAEGPSASSSAPVGQPVEHDQLVFIMSKIRSVDRSDHGRFVLFTVVGAAALFYCSYPSKARDAPPPPVRAIELSRPIVDFTLGPNDDVWISLDAEWGTSDGTSPTTSPFIKVLSWNMGELREARDSPLCTALNTTALSAATPADLKVLDLYSDLSSLPKNVDPDNDPLIRDTLAEAVAESAEGGRELTQRELGRLRKKKALQAHLQGKQADTGEGTPERDDDRDSKRPRSESRAGEEGVADAKMDES